MSSSNMAYSLVRYGPAREAFVFADVAKAPLLPGQVRIEVEAFGINFADIVLRQGAYRGAPELPMVPGYEVVGRIIETCAGAPLQLGQRVVALTRFGGYARQAVADASLTVPIPANMAPSEACALALQYCTAYYCCQELATLHGGERVLVHAAAGGVGSAIVQLLLQQDCVVFGTAGSDDKVARLRAMGVHYPINYRRGDFASVIVNEVGPRNLDLIFDSVGGKLFRQGLPLLASGGRIVCLGASSRIGKRRAGLAANLATALSFGVLLPPLLLLRSHSVCSVNMLAIAKDRPHILERCLRGVMEMHAAGRIKPLVGTHIPAAQLVAAHELVESRRSTGKVVAVW